MIKPILFSTEMVRAILEGQKTVTRRSVKFGRGQNPKWSGYVPDGDVLYGSNNIPAAKAPCQAGDVLWVRETWGTASDLLGGVPGPVYRADYTDDELRTLQKKHYRWRPSIHMPKEAARIFLQVKDVRVERLQDINLDPPGPKNQVIQEGLHYLCDFIAVWNRAIKPEERNRYGWYANPWVWVVEFERCRQPEGWSG